MLSKNNLISERLIFVPPPLIAHVVHKLAVGGLENGLINLVNRIPSSRYRHAIISLTDYTDYRLKIEKEVPVYALGKRNGHDVALFFRLWRLLRRLRPTVVHTRNLATLEMQLPAWMAGVPVRIHGEHGRDVHDLDNTRLKYKLLRAAFKPLIHRYVALSRDLEHYLINSIGVSADKITRISNGVDTDIYQPKHSVAVFPSDFQRPGTVVIGTVGRMESVKDPLTLVRAFIRLNARMPSFQSRLRLVLVGDGPLRRQVLSELAHGGLSEQSWVPGTRNDIPEVLRGINIFVLPSLAEGISNTILEAMATGIPVVATDVGGNSELIENERSGLTVPRGDPEQMALAMQRYVEDEEMRARHGGAGRLRAKNNFDIKTMVECYLEIYDTAIKHSRSRFAVRQSDVASR